MKCTPWKASGKTVKAEDTEAFNTYTVFDLSMTFYLKKQGAIEFKYRKDSKYGYVVNGVFKLIINDIEVMVDYDYTKSNWVVYKHALNKTGMYSIEILYTKYSEEGITEQMSAEIEYLHITGL